MLAPDGTPLLPCISVEQFDAMKRHLSRLNETLAVNFCMLSHMNGLLLLAVGDITSLKATSLASLLAANIAAAQQIAPLIGENAGFERNFFEGHVSSLYVYEINSDYILSTSFTSKTTFGLVRTTVERYATTLEELLAPQLRLNGSSTIEPCVSGSDFSEELSTKLTSLFKLEE